MKRGSKVHPRESVDSATASKELEDLIESHSNSISSIDQSPTGRQKSRSCSREGFLKDCSLPRQIKEEVEEEDQRTKNNTKASTRPEHLSVEIPRGENSSTVPPLYESLQ